MKRLLVTVTFALLGVPPFVLDPRPRIFRRSTDNAIVRFTIASNVEVERESE